MTDIEQKHLEIIEQLKNKISDIFVPDFDEIFLSRWLQARNWDATKAEKMLRNHLEWRKKNDIDGIYNWKAPEICHKYLPGGFFGHDKMGRPIWYELLGLVDVKNILLCGRKQDFIRYRIQTTDYIYTHLFPQLSAKMGHRVTKSVFIFDMDGVGLKHLYKPAIDVYTELLSTVEANYPETLSCCYVINAPSIFPILYNLIKSFLAPETRAKIKILGNNWKNDLLKDIDADQLPVHWGGTATDEDGDPYCKSKICLGGPIPESYKKAGTQKVDLTNFTSVNVGRGVVINIEQKVTVPKTLLRWAFWTDNNDIGFGVLRQIQGGDGEEPQEEVVKMSRVNSHLVPEEGCFVCADTGTYVVRFDNTHSWFTGKKLSYCVELTEPASSDEFVGQCTNF